LALVAHALRANGGGSNLLQRGEQNADQQRNDTDDDEQLNQCESRPAAMKSRHIRDSSARPVSRRTLCFRRFRARLYLSCIPPK
jgi:hypothetical protein